MRSRTLGLAVHRVGARGIGRFAHSLQAKRIPGAEAVQRRSRHAGSSAGTGAVRHDGEIRIHLVGQRIEFAVGLLAQGGTGRRIAVREDEAHGGEVRLGLPRMGDGHQRPVIRMDEQPPGIHGAVDCAETEAGSHRRKPKEGEQYLGAEREECASALVIETHSDLPDTDARRNSGVGMVSRWFQFSADGEIGTLILWGDDAGCYGARGDGRFRAAAILL